MDVELPVLIECRHDYTTRGPTTPHAICRYYGHPLLTGANDTDLYFTAPSTTGETRTVCAVRPPSGSGGTTATSC